jgi:hypothetical protein
MIMNDLMFVVTIIDDHDILLHLNTALRRLLEQLNQ